MVKFHIICLKECLPAYRAESSLNLRKKKQLCISRYDARTFRVRARPRREGSARAGSRGRLCSDPSRRNPGWTAVERGSVGSVQAAAEEMAVDAYHHGRGKLAWSNPEVKK